MYKYSKRTLRESQKQVSNTLFKAVCCNKLQTWGTTQGSQKRVYIDVKEDVELGSQGCRRLMGLCYPKQILCLNDEGSWKVFVTGLNSSQTAFILYFGIYILCHVVSSLFPGRLVLNVSSQQPVVSQRTALRVDLGTGLITPQKLLPKVCDHVKTREWIPGSQYQMISRNSMASHLSGRLQRSKQTIPHGKCYW